MNIVRRLLRRLRPQMEARMDEEMRFHLEMQARQNREAGMPAGEAHRAAVLTFGGVEQVKEVCREQQPLAWLRDLVGDLRYGGRVLRRSLGFTAVGVLTLGLGIGACTAIFSVVNGVLLRPLPIPEPERIVVIRESFLPTLPDASVASGKYLDWQRQAASFESLGALSATSYNLTGAGDPLHLHAARMTASMLSTLRLSPLLGRNFAAEEQRPQDQENVAILSHGLWQRRFAGDAAVLGRRIQLNGRPFTVVGVMPPETGLPEWVEVFTPYGFRAGDELNYDGPSLYVVGRLRAGVTPAEAQSEMNVLAARTAAAHPMSRGWSTRVSPMTESIVGKVRPVLLSLLGAVGFLLLIACANVANLLLARATSRSREMAVRAALGARGGRIIRQLLSESVLLSLLGGGLGVLLAQAGLPALLALAPEALPRAADLAVDGRALGLTFALALVTGLGFGLAPAFQASRVDLNQMLKQGGRGATEGGAPRRLRGALVIGEVAIALVLLAGAGLLMRSFARLQQVSPGFNPEGAHVAETYLPRTHYPDGGQYVSFAEQTMASIAALAIVQTVAVANNLPFSDHHMTSSTTVRFGLPNRPPPTDAEMPAATHYTVSPDYFRAMGIPLLRGRPFDQQDVSGARRVTIVSESVARKLFPGEDPLGKIISLYGSARREIVGIAGDIKPKRLDSEATLQIYEPFAQVPDNDIIYVVRTAVRGADEEIASAIHAAIARADPTVPIYGARPLTAVVGGSIARQRFAMTLFTVFSLVALLLAAMGIYGVMAYSIAQRTGEIGIRVALGAHPRDVVALVFRQGGKLIALGVLAGVLGALLLTRFLEKLLFNVSVRDPLTFAAIVVVLVLVATSACLLPAHRASRVSPMVALRAE
jgi:putative ABC transport system permease protein